MSAPKTSECSSSSLPRRLTACSAAKTIFNEVFGASDFGDFSSGLGIPLPRHREAVDIDQYLSALAKELIQQAGQTAVEFNRDEVDTEHLLYAISSSDVVKEIYKQFKIDPQEVRRYIEANAPKGEKTVERGETLQLGISPRIKRVVELAFQAALELGHSYIGPEHLLIGLVEEEDGMAGDLLRKYGLTPEAVRQKVVKVVGKGAQEGRVETQSTTPHLDKYSRDLTKLAKEGKLDPVIGAPAKSKPPLKF
jgi:ATP-dependent Clp protease ATP-binding subunit ClpC